MISTLAVVVVMGLLGRAIWRNADPAVRAVSRSDVWMVALLPPLLLGTCLLTAYFGGRLGENRLGLQVIEAQLETSPLWVGGEVRTDDLVVPGAPQRMLEIRKPEDGPVEVRFHPNGAPVRGASRPPAAEPPFLLAHGAGSRAKVAGARPIREGDAICLARCGRPDATWFVLQNGRLVRGVVDDGRVRPPTGREPRTEGAPIPTRQVFGVIPNVSDWRPNQAIHPVAHYAPAKAGGRPARSFLFRVGGLHPFGWFGGGLRVALLDPGAQLAPGGRLADAKWPAAAQDRLAEPRVYSLWEVRILDAPPDQADGQQSRLVERRSFTATPTPEGVRIDLHTPDVLLVPGCSRGRLARPVLVGAGDGALPGALDFPSLGGETALAASGVLETPERICGRLRTQEMSVGDLAAASREVTLRLTHFGLPVLMLLIPLAWAFGSAPLLAAVAARSPVAWMLAGVLQLLLALRWLIALQGAALDPALPWDALLSDAAVAYVAAPVAFFALVVPLGCGARRAWLLAGLVAAGALAGQFAWTGPPSRLSFVTLVLSAMLVGASALAGSARVRDRLTAAARAAVARIGGLAAGAGRWPSVAHVPWWGWCFIAAVTFRIALGLAGFKERLGLALSAVYSPLIILGFAGLFAAALVAETTRRLRLLALFIVMLAVTVVAVPAAVSDKGYAMVLAPIAGLAAAAAFLAAKDRLPTWERFGWSTPALAALAFLVAILAGGGLNAAAVDTGRLTTLAKGPEADAVAFLQEQTRHDQNALRVALLVAPDALVETGTAEAENLRAWSSQLSAYTDVLIGREYLAPSRLGPVLRPVQLNDNLSAVHIMSPFGRIGMAAILLLLAILPFACARRTSVARRPARPAGEIAGLLSLWVLFGVAAYVVLGNLQLVPFSGRNIYLLAADSGSDVIEGWTLFALAARGLLPRTPA